MKRIPVILLVFVCMASAAAAQSANVDRNAQFWSDVKDVRATETWKSLESATNVMREADAPAGTAAAVKNDAPENKNAPKKESVRDRYIFNMSVDQPQEVAKFVAKVATNKIAGADGAIATVVNMRTSPGARKAAAAHVPPAAKTDYLALVERIPPRRYFSDPFAGTATTSAFLPAPRPAAPTGYVPVRSSSFGCPVR